MTDHERSESLSLAPDDASSRAGVNPAWALSAMLALSALFSCAAMTLLWTGPWGKDAFFYTDAAFLRELDSRLALRYVHIYSLTAVHACLKPMALAAGVYALVQILGVSWLSFLFGLRIAGPSAGVLGAALTMVLPLIGGFNATNPECDFPALLYSGLALYCVLPRQPKWRAPCWFLAGALVLTALRAKETSAVVCAPLLWLWLRERSGRPRCLAYAIAGVVAGQCALMVIDGFVFKDACIGLRPSTYLGQVSHSLRRHADPTKGPNFVDLLAARWILPAVALCGLGICYSRAHDVASSALMLWALTALAFQSVVMSMSYFPANDRYLISVVFPLIPLAGAWVVTEVTARQEARGRPWLVYALACAAAVMLLGLAAARRAPHFPKKSFHMLFPSAAIAAAFALPRLRVGSVPRKALVLGLTAYAFVISIYVSTNKCRGLHGNALRWMRVGQLICESQEPTVAMVGHTDWFTHLRLSTYSNNRALIADRLQSVPDKPSVHVLLVANRIELAQPPSGYRFALDIEGWAVYVRSTEEARRTDATAPSVPAHPTGQTQKHP